LIILELDKTETDLTLFLFMVQIWHWFYLWQLVESSPTMLSSRLPCLKQVDISCIEHRLVQMLLLPEACFY